MGLRVGCSKLRVKQKQGWEFAHRFSERITHFLLKNEGMSDSLKKPSDSLIRSFLVSDSLTSLFQKKGMNKLHFPKNFLKSYKKWFYSIFLANRSFFVSERANEGFAKKQAIRSFVLLLRATWAIPSWSLFCQEQPEQFAHSRSFVLIDLSK